MSAPDIKEAPPATGDAHSKKQDIQNLRGSRRDVNSIKAELGDIPSLWQRLNLHGEPPQRDGVCHSPFREDKRPSFSVYDSGQRWRDHAEGTGGDTLDFYARAKDISTAGAISELRGEQPTTWHPVKATTHKPREKEQPKRKPLRFKLDSGSISEMNQLRYQRALVSWGGIQILFDCGMFGFCTMQDGPERVRCIMLTDSSRRNAAARRLDGKPWQSLNGKPKSKTLAASQAGWPIGTPLVEDADTVFMVEGETDALALASWAVFDYQGRWSVVSMTGTNSISEDALPYYKGKFVCLLPDNDEPGLQAAKRRFQQLTQAGARVSIQRPGREGQDLNDVVSAISFYSDDDDTEGRIA